MMSSLRKLLAGSVGLVSLAAAHARADDIQPLWGDTHVHSSYSLDAYVMGNTTVDPAAAYRFAKGIPVLDPQSGHTMRLKRPLDFLVVSDHAELLGMPRSIGNDDKRLTQSSVGKGLYELISAGKLSEAFRRITEILFDRPDIRGEIDRHDVQFDNWSAIVDAADAANSPGSFTSFVGWEWTATPSGNNLHRVIFTDASGSKAKAFFPFNLYDSERPEDLWAFLDKTSKAIDADFVAIPHNSNVSGGLMFGTTDSDGRPIDRRYAQIRARWEPVVEITQTKGTSETHGSLSPNDEFATFEYFPSMLLDRRPATPAKGDYVRSALLSGLEIERRLGINPYKFGVIGSTDTHTGLTSVDESNFLGKMPDSHVPKNRWHQIGNSAATDWDISASGRAAVWARENTRAAIMEAFKRREVYGTTGPRIVLRFFGGFAFRDRDAQDADLAATGYDKGVPMGSDITRPPAGRAPSFLVQAVKDPMEANLDRVQIVKGWLDRNGKNHEKVYDIAWSGERTPGPGGILPAVDNTVNLEAGRYTNTVGASQLRSVWIDPDFDPSTRAFYYVRVLQIPTPRNSLFDALALGIDVKETGQPATIQERAYSSPIWYTPS